MGLAEIHRPPLRADARAAPPPAASFVDGCGHDDRAFRGVSIPADLIRRQFRGRRIAASPGPTVPKGDRAMRVMVMVKATKNSEAGILPGDPRAPAGYDKLFEQMGKFNEELVKAGIMLAGDGLHPSNKGKRVRFSGGKKTVIDGPFAETKELVAGYWIWQVKSMDEALEWVRRCPDPMPGEESEIEIRLVYEAEDFGKGLTPELRAQEERLRAEIERQRKS
jgi:hypothetical protein